MFFDLSLIRWLIMETEDIRLYPELNKPKTGREDFFLSLSGTN